MNLKKGTLLFILLTCLAYTTLAQTHHTLKYEDLVDENGMLTIDDDGMITACSYDFNANKATGGTNLTIPKSVTKDSEIIIKGIQNNVFKEKNLVAVAFNSDSEVTTIGNYAFKNNSIVTLTLPTSTLPTSLTTIGKQAFQNNQLTTLTLPASLTTIGESAFYGNKIKTLTLPTALTTIGDYVFFNNSLTTVIFKDSNKSQIQSIGSNAFSSNTGLAGITLPEIDGGTGVTYKDSNDQVYQPGATFTNFERSIVMLYTLQKGDLTVNYQGIITVCLRCEEFVSKRIIIPEKIGDITITGIVDKTWPDKGVFQEKNLVAVAFASDSKVTTIGSFAFKTNPIVTLTLPTSLTTIGNQAFQNNLVTTLTVPASLTTMGSSAFYNNEIKTLTLPTTLTTIGEYVFYDNQITELTFPENSKLTTIGQWAFGANQITELTLPTTLTSIGKSAFAANLSLESFTLPSITKERFRTYWQDGDSKDLGTNLTITDFGKSFKLVSIEQVTLTVEVNDKEGGSIEPPDDRFVIDKADPPSTQELTAKPNDGWRFDKWVITSGEDGNGNPITETFDVGVDVKVDADKTATAYFVEQVTLTTSVEGQQGGTISATPNHSLEDNQYDINTKVTLTATPNDGWRFDKWIITSGEDGNGNSITETVDVVGVEVTADADKTATAHFVKLVTLTTAVAEQQGGTIARLVEPNNDKEEYDINTKVTLTATPNDGWRFDRWVISDEENETDKTTTITLDKNKTATAHFVEQVTLTLIIEETEASGEVSGLSAGKNKIDKGADFKLKATPASGQKFVSWTIGVETIVTEEYTLPATDTETDISITVTFEAIPLDEQITFTLDIVGEGSTTPDKGENIYKKDKDVELTATPNDGWRFDKWVISDEENKTDKTTTITLNQDKTVTAHFVQLVTLTTSVEGQQGGTISTTPKPSLEDNQYDINTKVTLTAKPDEGWKFDKWVIGTDEITENPTTITLDKNKSVTAHFVKEEAITSILTEVVSATPYPNPVTSQITLKAKDGDLIQLFSQKGEQQYSAQHTGNEVHTIDVSTMPVGVYLVRITDAEGNTTTKRILKK